MKSYIALQFYRDRLRTTNNVLGDCYTAAIVEHLSQKELALIDAGSASDNKNPAKNSLENSAD